MPVAAKRWSLKYGCYNLNIIATTPMAEKYTAVDVTKDNRAIAARGSKVEFKAKGKSGTVAAGYDLKYKDATAFSPRKLLLQDAGRSMLLLSPDKRNVVVQYDTEYGKNLGEVALKAVHQDLSCPIDKITTPTKFSALQPSSVVEAVGVSGNSLFDFKWDPREKGDNLIIGEENRFSKNTRHFKFTSLATTGKGHVVAGGTDGHIRLFTKGSSESDGASPWKRPKTDISQLADPVTGLDVSRDGSYIVWTTKKYIAVISAEFKDADGNVASGFEKPMGTHKPNTLICRLSSEDLELMGMTQEEVNLTPAVFDNGPSVGDSNVLEEDIMTSTGSFILRWKFRRIKLAYKKLQSGKKFEPVRPDIIRQGGEVVDRRFLYGKGDVVAALEHDLSFLTLGEKEEQEEEEEEEEEGEGVGGDDDDEDDEEDEDYEEEDD